MSKKSNGRKPTTAKRASGLAATGRAEKESVSARKPISATKSATVRSDGAERESARPRRTSGSANSYGTGESAQSPAAATEVKVSAAKGRPMLTWVGKRPLKHVKAFPAQLVESFAPEVRTSAGGRWSDWPARYPAGGLLFHGDNKEVLAHLLANGFRGKVKLVYIDPPFDSGADYVRKVSLRGAKGTAKLEGEHYTLGEQIQYTDIWANDNYLQFMFERLLLIKELLHEEGVIFVHTNQERTHLIRCILDEVFGAENFRNDIVWKRGPGKSHPEYFGRVKDTILFYSKGTSYTWNKQFKAISEAYERTFRKRDERGRYVTQPLHSGRPAKAVPFWRGIRPPDGRGWAYKIATLDEFEANGLIEWSEDGVPRLKRYLNDVEGAAIQDVWDDIADAASSELLQQFFAFLEELSPDEAADVWSDIAPVLDRSLSHTGYPTQKPVALVERMIRACSRPGDLVLDCFVGSGTTAVAAQLLGRRWIGCDINKGAIQTSAKRLHSIINTQSAAQAGLGVAGDEAPPAQLSFTTWRVNNYDLQVQHNEALNLAADVLGVQRTRTDSYFDGTVGQSLAKIIPFGRPLTPLDLEELQRELDARPDEDRPITVVCLGMELAAQTWVDEWNALRRGASAVNKIHVVELRTDPKYGGFLKHEPASARVRARRRGDHIQVEVVDFVSPSIVERLQQQAGVLAPRIDDWRAMVDCVMIDPAYDGQAFNVSLTDVPERKSDFVEGRYEFLAPPERTTVAVKIIDMLGEEVVETCEV